MSYNAESYRQAVEAHRLAVYGYLIRSGAPVTGDGYLGVDPFEIPW
jgi:hypothetical protein